ncbi:bone morphogenetic protein 15 [Callorhinchus milii]|uniref:bone morphogenetic protein 15 n=1 Tax=Callorhinchus milii TaxID=7868 RepID=UPI001C3FEA12|nr:bone morphogenetic protein 15 [Callorhinchus milii]
MVHLYQRSADQLGKPRANRTLTTNTIRLLKPCASLVLPSTGPWYTHYVQYNLKHLPELEHLVKVAVVYLYKNAMISCEIRCVPATYAHSKLLQNATSLELPIRLEVKLNNRWSEADVTSCVLFPNRNNAWKLDLHISYMCTKQGKNSRGKKRKVPFHLPVPSLLLFLNDTDEAAHQRKRGEDSQIPVIPKSKILSRKPRQLSNIGSDIPNYLRKKNLPRNQCKLRSFLVSFQQLGWDHWIIAPPKYDPKFCKGACPRILHYGYHSPNHAIVQTFINEIIDKNVPRPSCVPLKYNPISVLLKENDQIVYKEYEDMIAVSCTCK